MQFTVTPSRRPGGTVVAVAGEFDVATAPEFTAAVQDALEPPPSALVVDLTATTFADSSACRVLVQTAKACRRLDCTLEVVCPESNTAVRRVLDIVGLAAVAPLREDVRDTVAGAPTHPAPAAVAAREEAPERVGRADRPA